MTVLGAEVVVPSGLPTGTEKALRCFLAAYPGCIESVQSEESRVTLTMASGAVVVFEDYLPKKYQQRIDDPDLADTLHDAYPAEMSFKTWPEGLDPGRYRSDAFLGAIYGSTKSEVKKNLVTVDFLGHKLSFNQCNGAAAALKKVAADLAEVLKKKPGLKPHLENLGGTYNWRKVAGTSRLSAHSYGISIDLNTDLGAYWQWEKKQALAEMKKRLAYPQEIVKVFEKHGFIWGGKWYYYDLMHFEYRPELLPPHAP
ncbi:MAG: M15 family metallopeptidase [Verrucomicrobiaceae bacterium]|nr:M15 family metallopeptidase [Verrucomicrobiaceae bacterium]